MRRMSCPPAAPAGAVDRQEARQPRRHLDACESRLALHRVAHPQPEVEREARDVGERQPGTDGQRRQHRVHLAVELDVDLARGLGARSVTTSTPFSASPGAVPRARCGSAPRQLAHALGDPVEDLLAGQLVRGGRPAARRGRPARRDAHHEELVEVAREDREELAALEQRHLGPPASASTRALKSSQDSSRLM